MNRSLLFLFLIILLAIFIRTYHIHSLAVFIADQAIMSTETLQIIRGNLTLIGPSASIAPLFFGPIVFYLMVPFYLATGGYPLAGTIFQTTLQILTIPLIYFIGKRVKNEKAGLFAAFLFAVSGLFVEYSRGSFNTTTALSFSTLIILVFFSLLKQYKSWKVLLVGILLGCMVQMNFITVSLFIAIAAFPLFYHKLASFKYFGLLILGVTIGFSDYILFELRHNFFNTHAMLTYLFGGGSSSAHKSVMYLLTDGPTITARIFYGMGNLWLGAGTLLLTAIGILYLFKKKATNLYLNFLLFLIANVLLISLIYGRHLESIYLIVIHTSLIVLVATMIVSVFEKRLILIVLTACLIGLFNAPQWNLHKPIHDLQDGIYMSDFKKAAVIIQNDTPGSNINVAMDAQRDNRAMPLRYFLLLYNIPVLNYDNYGNADELYFIERKTKDLQNITVWEYKAFGANEIDKMWEINDQYVMYKLKRAAPFTPSN
jgi:4-amino-4-deoxy-L-arabinose transferase-like glycosyltransferase